MKKKIISAILICMLSINVVSFSYIDSYAIGMEGALVLGGADLAFLTGVGEVLVVAGLVGVAGYKTYQLLSTFDYARLNTAWNNLTSAQRTKIHNKALTYDGKKPINLTKDEFSDYGLNKVFNSYKNAVKVNKQVEDLKEEYYSDGNRYVKYISNQQQISKSAVQNLQKLKPYDKDFDVSVTYSSRTCGAVKTDSGFKFDKKFNKYRYPIPMIHTVIAITMLARAGGSIQTVYLNYISAKTENYGDVSAFYVGNWQYSFNIQGNTGVDSYNCDATEDFQDATGFPSTYQNLANNFALAGNGSVCYSPPVISNPSVSLPQDISVPMDNSLEGQEQEDAKPFEIPQVRPDVLTHNPALDDAISKGEPIVDDSFPVTGDDTIPDDPSIPSDPSLDLSIPNGSIDFTPLTNALMEIKTVFPFCIPWDILNTFKMLSKTPKVPSILVDLKGLFPYLNVEEGLSFEFNLKDFKNIAILFRWITLIIFVLGLAKITRSVIRS